MLYKLPKPGTQNYLNPEGIKNPERRIKKKLGTQNFLNQ